METVGYCLRLQALEGYREKITTMTLVEDYTALLAIKHDGNTKENPHYHIVIRTKVKDQAFRVRMKKTFPDGKGNGHMSMKAWDGRDEAFSYLFHELEPDEKEQIIASKGLDEARIQELRTLNNNIKTKVKEAAKKASWTLEEDAYTHFRALLPEHYKVRELPQEVDIGSFMILHALRAGKYPPQAWLVRAMTARVLFRLVEGNEEHEQQYARKIASNIFYVPN